MATGFVLNIDEKLLKNLERADELVIDIGKQSEKTRDLFNNAFNSMTTGSLQNFINKLNEARDAMSSIGSSNVQFNGVVNVSQQAVQASDEVVKLVSTLAKLKHIMSQMGGENFSTEGLFNMGGQTKELTKELRKDLRKTQTWMTKLKEATDAYENSIGNLSADLARARDAQRAFNEEMKRASKNQVEDLISRQGNAKTLNELKAYAKELRSVMANLDPKTKEWQKLNNIYKQTNREIKTINDSMKDLNNRHKSLINTADQLKRAFALVFSVSAIRGYVTQIARVRGEFELQQRSLQAILQNKDEADRLWQQTIQLAVRSPFQVKELVTYTKQLAAYHVESDKLYDTTKMLADVSAGLGVDMNRLILAYGQVKAANYLRGTELRQFSEAGINILAKLAKYFTELEGRAVSVGEVFERVSKRMVTFADVEEIFKRVTSEGGIFYNMQEIQAETLKGQISNLRDAVDIMLNDIGKQNEHLLKTAVGTIRIVVQNWEALVPILKAVVAGFALTRVNALLAKESILLMARDFGVLVNAEQRALTVTQLLNVGWKSFVKNIKAAGAAAKAFVASNPILAALTAILYVLVKVGSTWMEHKREIDEINKKYQDLSTTIKSISNKFSFVQEQGEVEGLRKELNQLIDLANREYNMDIKVDVSKLNTSELAQKFIEIREKIFDAQEVAKTFGLAMQKVASWKFDKIDIFGDLDKAEESVLEQFSVFRKAAADTVYELEQIQHKLTQSQIDALNELRQPQQIDETQFQYVKRLRDAYSVLMQNYIQADSGFTGGAARRNRMLDEWSQKLKNVGIDAERFSDILREWDILEANAKEEFDELFDLVETQFNAFTTIEEKEYMLKFAIDSQGLTDIERELAYRFANERFVGINIVPKISPTTEDDKGSTPDDDKQNKLTSKRISLIKELRREYEQLNKTFDRATSKEKVIASYTNAVNEAFKGTGITIADIKFESLEELAESLEGLKSLAAKEGTEAKLALEKAISGIRVQFDVEAKNEADKKLKAQVEELFSRYEFALDLEKLGISKDLMKSLFDVEAIDLSDIKSELGTLKPQFDGGDMLKEYDKYLQKIQEMEDKAAIERTKTYVKYLMEAQRDAVKIKIEELRKIKEIEDTEFTPEQKAESKERVRQEAEVELQQQEWADFKNTEMYTMMFEDLEHYGTQALETLREKLEELKGSLTDLPANEVKEIINQLSKIEDITIERNPFKAFKDARLQIKKSEFSEDEAQIGLAQSENRIAELQAELDIINIINTAKSKGLTVDKETQYIYDDIVAEMDESGIAGNDIVATKEKSLKKEKETAKALAENVNNYRKLSKTQEAAMNKTKAILGSIQDATKASMQLMDSLGVSTDSVAYSLAEGVDGMISLTLSAIEFTIQLDAMEIAANQALGIIGWIAIGIQAVATAISAIFKMHDAGLQKQIDKLAEQTEDLQENFDAVRQSVDEAYNTDALRKATKESELLTKQMISNYEKMKRLEEDKKKTDKDAIKEYEENIKQQREALRELEAQVISEATAGIFDDTLSTARGFVDAWYDAFLKVGDGLDGLEDNFEEMFLDLAKQQAAMQIVSRFVKQWETDLSKYINEDDTELTAADAQEWAEKVKATFGPMNDALKSYLGVMDEIVGSTGELSGLQAGIQGITESQAEIISAYLNSIRFFVSDNNGVMKQLRDYVIGTDETANPMLAQLRIIAQQTAAINSLLSSLTKGGHTEGGLGLKVFIN